MLQMVKASLRGGTRPGGSNGFEGRTLSVRRKGHGIQPSLLEVREPSERGPEPFLGDVEVGECPLGGCTHESHQAAILVEVGAIQNQMLEWTEVLALGWGLLKPVVFDPLELGDTMTREI